MPKVPERTQHFSQKLELASAQTCRNTNDFLRGKLIFDFLGPNPNGERGLQNGLDFTPVDYSCQDSFDHFAQLSLVELQVWSGALPKIAPNEFLPGLFHD